MFPTKLVVSSRSFIENMARSIIQTAIFLFFGLYSFVSKADIPLHDVDSVLLHANRKIDSKQYNDALALVDSFIIFQQKQPHLDVEVLAQAYLTKGMCYQRSGDFQKSISQNDLPDLDSLVQIKNRDTNRVRAVARGPRGRCYSFWRLCWGILESLTRTRDILF